MAATLATLPKEEINDLALTYAALLLHDGGVNVTGDKLAQVVKAAAIDVPPFYVKLYARVLANRNLDDLLFQTVAVAPSAAPAAGAAAPAEAAAAGDKPAGKPAKDEEEEEAEDMDWPPLLLLSPRRRSTISPSPMPPSFSTMVAST